MRSKNVPAALKLLNRKIVYGIISTEGGISRAGIARKTGISGATVLKIAEYLASRNIITYDTAESMSLPGRKPSPIRFNRNFACIIAVYMEGLFASMGILNASGGVITTREFEVPDVALFIQNEFYRGIDSLIASSGVDRRNLAGIGLAVPAALDSQTRHVYRAPPSHAAWLANLQTLSAELGSRYGLPIFVENDVNAAAYGEYKRVYSGITGSLVYLSVGSGLGGGIILDGKLWKGQNASAGEIGYLVLERERETPPKGVEHTLPGAPSPDSPGWLEGKTGLAALKERFDFDVHAPRDAQKEARVTAYLSEYLALAILNISAVLDIQTVVLGGVLADHLADGLIDGVRRALETRSPYRPSVVSGKLKNPSFAGLSCIIMDELLDELLSR
ncbi:MAG: ROK family protein [Treponema sp.]|jgi:predicted NBD/HSP70 family sugar kinase|nr:ROK family protein [Treponema sp.]